MKYKQLFYFVASLIVITISSIGIYAWIETPNVIDTKYILGGDFQPTKYQTFEDLANINKVYANDFIVTIDEISKSEVSSLSGYRDIQIVKRDASGNIVGDFQVGGFSLVNQTISNANDIIKLKLALCKIDPTLEICK